jgi:hypothetical protein
LHGAPHLVVILVDDNQARNFIHKARGPICSMNPGAERRRRARCKTSLQPLVCADTDNIKSVVFAAV